MEIGRLLGKREREEDEGTFLKRWRGESVKEERNEKKVEREEDEKERVLRLLGESDSMKKEELNASGVKRLLYGLEKKILLNQEMRVKHVGEPEKFMASELALNDEVQKAKELATVPEHYGLVIELGGFSSLVSLLDHENSSVGVGVLELLSECTDVEEEGGELLVKELLRINIGEGFVRLWEKLDEEKDESGTYSLLSIIENCVDVEGDMAGYFGKNEKLMGLVCKHCKAEELKDEQVRLYCSEILSILLSTEEEEEEGEKNMRWLFGEWGLLDEILHCLAVYRKRDVESVQELEYMENLFSSVCSLLLYDGNCVLFVECEGVELMLLLIKSKMLCRFNAVKVLDFALRKSELACLHFVEVLGLKTLFPLFMKTPSFKKKGSKLWKKAAYSARQFEEHVVCILSSLLRNITQRTHRLRVMNKFVENGYEKGKRLANLCLLYQSKVKQNEDEDEDDDSVYLELLDAGLFTLQQLALIIGHIARDKVDSKLLKIVTKVTNEGGALLSIITMYKEKASAEEEALCNDMLVALK
eukprot:Nk52_evm4s293 gene=Nk52_evmTU4s293